MFSLVQTLFNFFIMRGMGWLYLKRFNSWVDVALMIINITTFFQFTIVLNTDMQEASTYTFKRYRSDTEHIRQTLVGALLLMFSKMGYFLSLVDRIAPLIDIIIKIFRDIIWFMFVLFLVLISFSLSFYLLAQNQINFSNITD